KETSRILSVPEGTVKSRVHKARAALALSLGDEGLMREIQDGP
ncbi:MAG: sigma factor-like helix-turn-helix DNA-binding protein, partial [Actinomycetota bacterium]